METKQKYPVRTGTDRSFGVTFTVFFLLVALLPVLKGRPPRLWGGGVAGLFLILSLLRPPVLHPLNVLWARFGRLLGRVTEPVFAAVIYGIAILPFGLLLKLFKPDMMKMQYNPDAKTYWTVRERTASSMKNQY